MNYRLKIVYKDGKVAFKPAVAYPNDIFNVAWGFIVIDYRRLIDHIDVYDANDNKLATFYS